ncbi:hypothetical protein [Amycolatopsis sp. WQ 127309]|uniref:hypothetical protein n=1 Tax=Amycolatopsis sp. WQ 127309 TaxID=2932773 RepID=UPI001FF6BC2C|nr:hypothetical protein [Amycolatopsis sp. WQ 127309]UOZ07954.1 hypothetical protein MUY22_06635 [Amycolatopsis sp. WQ 127309]
MRNPYLLLGIDYGTPPDLARRHFARAARRVRRAAGGPVGIEDLNWALHEVQNRAGTAEDDVSVYRVPANPAVFTPLARGLFALPPIRLPRRTDTSDDDRAVLADELAKDVGELVTTVIRATATFDYGYLTPEGNEL